MAKNYGRCNLKLLEETNLSTPLAENDESCGGVGRLQNALSEGF